MNKLFQPVKVGTIELKNRLAMLPMGGLNLAEDGSVSDRFREFLVERAKGGVGIIMTPVNPWPGVDELVPSLSDDSHIANLKKLVDEVHTHGAKISANIRPPRVWLKKGSAGVNGKPEEEYVGPSAVTVRSKALLPRPLTVEEIQMSIDRCGTAARRAREASFDAIQVGAGIGGLLNQFMSPATNKREDEYGGSLEKRMRIIEELIADIKKKAGDDFTIFFRFSAQEFVNGGWDLEGGKEVAGHLEKIGVDCLNCQVGWHDSAIPLFQKEVPSGHWAYLAAGIKQVVKVPVITGYRYDDPVVAERVLQEEKADIIGMARAFISDPEFANKVRESRIHSIRRCIVCCRCIDQAVGAQEALELCSVNPRVGKDIVIPIQPAQKPKKVMVIGAGPGGLMAAKTAAERGHEVMLFDKSPKLGGLMVLGNILNKEIGKLINHLSEEIKKLPIEIRLGQEINLEQIHRLKPDAVIIAVGGTSLSLDVEGTKGDNVLSVRDINGLLSNKIPQKGNIFHKLLWRAGSLVLRYFYVPPFIRWVLGLGFPFGKNVAIIGSGFAACELADYLGEKGKNITLIDSAGRVGTDIGRSTRFVTMQRLRKFKVKMETNSTIEKITANGVSYTRENASQFCKSNSVVLAMGLKPNGELAEQLEGTVPVIHRIGDCNDPQKIGDAIKAGFRVARDL